MGYFSKRTIDQMRQVYDHSILAPEQQLLLRLEALEQRLEELRGKRRNDYGACFREEELRCILPKDLKAMADVRAAIELAVTDLADRYGIYLREQPREELPELDELTDMQISFLDVSVLGTHWLPSAA